MLDGEAKANGSFNAEQRLNGNRGGDDIDAVPSSSSWSTGRPGHHAKIPVYRDSPNYNMNHKYRGMAIIFNHEHFEIPRLNSRTGTNVDRDNLSKVLKTLGFEVTELNDLTSSKVNRYVQQTAEMDHTDFDCLIIAVLTHGELGRLYAKDKDYNPENLWQFFTGDNCPTLAGKPKIFFIQACQGDKSDESVNCASYSEVDATPFTSYKIPVHADFLIVFSTVPGYFSWRVNNTRGSWFIQALCEELSYAGANRDILTLLTFVCRRVALDFQYMTPGLMPIDQKKKVPCISSMLLRLLVFEKKLSHS